ncbi:MAG: flagellar assembly protein FliX [Alphaproteobacteria bacterium]|nr:flagellar assembly protein FliX [Alphaproteobacteria bacterium]
MKISQAGSSTPAGRSRKAGKASETGADDTFKRHIEDGGAPPPAAPVGTAPLAALSSLLAVQEAPDPTVGTKRAVLHGDTLLDELRELQIGLVQGWVSEDSLKSLAHMLDQPRPAIDDPDLNQVLDDIELRAAVELAKFERDRS